MADGETFLKQSRLREGVAEPLGADVVLLDGSRHNWPAAMPTHSFVFNPWICELQALSAGRKIILVGHSDGATMALRLAVACRDIVAGVVSYAGVWSHFSRGAGEPMRAYNVPPLLLLNNKHDTKVSPDNMLTLGEWWRLSGGTVTDKEIECPYTKGLKSHLWQPDKANRFVQEWITLHAKG